MRLLRIWLCLALCASCVGDRPDLSSVGQELCPTCDDMEDGLQPVALDPDLPRTSPRAGGAIAIAPEVQVALAELARTWRSRGHVYREGTFDTPQGQQLRRALEGTELALSTNSAERELTPLAAVPCQGSFPSNGVATVIVQQSAIHGVPWGVQLSPGNASLGTVVFNAQIYAAYRQANVYASHIQPWNYLFHGPLPIPFDVVGGGTYSMQPGDYVSFLWYWYSAAQPMSGGYAYLNCTFSPV